VETDNALPNPSVEIMAQASVKIDDERISDSIESEEVLKCVLQCHNEPQNAIESNGKSSSSKQQQSCKYDAEACLSMVLLDLIESSKGSKEAVKCPHHTFIVASSSTWVRFGRMSLSFSDRDEIAGGVQLNDKQINYTKSILKCQFSIPGLQFTLLQMSSIPRVNKLQIVHIRGNHWITASKIM